MAERGVMGYFSGWIGMALIYAGLNGALYIGQEISSKGHEREAEKIEAELGALERQIDQVALWIAAKMRESDAIDALGEKLDQSDRFYTSSSGYQADLRRFNDQVDQWNAGLSQLEREAGHHDHLVVQYNELVDRYNTVSKAAYSRWWLLPFPAPSRAASSAGRR